MMRPVTAACFLIPVFLLINTVSSGSENVKPVSIPGMVTVEATTREAPPSWAVKQRHLIKTMNEAAPLYLDKFTFRDGSVNIDINIGADNIYEAFKEWPLFYIIGGDENILNWSIKEWNAITRQLTFLPESARGALHKEFVVDCDQLHLTEGYVGFQYFGLADPTIPEYVDRSRRFAGFYLNEDPDIPPEHYNYDPKYKIIRSIATGSSGAANYSDPTYTLNYSHASLYPIVKKLEDGWSNNPSRKKEIIKIFNKVVTPCDVVANLAYTGLITHAYILTGDEKYKKWVLEYVDAWMDRIKQNNGIIPDNIGRTGKIGEYRNGQWWGGFFGWSTRYSVYVMFTALITASECAYTLSGDPRYLDLLRSQVDVLLSMAKEKDGNLLIPFKHGVSGWYDYRPMEPFILSHLWHASMDPKDWERIEKIRKGTKNGPYAEYYDPVPGPSFPEVDIWHPDGSLFDWNMIYNNPSIYNNRHRLNEAPHLSYLGGTHPDWPDKILDAEYEQVCNNVDRYRTGEVAITGGHAFLALSPIFTNGLAQMTMGAPFQSFNGGLLCARVRYFDIDHARPGLPQDVAALVQKLESDCTVVQLVNVSAFETRRLIIQAGGYGEHEFTEVTYKETENKDGKEYRKKTTIKVNKHFFAVELQPSTTITLDIGTKRFINKPTYAFPWHENK